MSDQQALPLPEQKCELRLACIQMQGVEPARSVEELLRLYPCACRREVMGTIKDCPRRASVRMWMTARGKGEAGRLA